MTKAEQFAAMRYVYAQNEPGVRKLKKDNK